MSLVPISMLGMADVTPEVTTTGATKNLVVRLPRELHRRLRVKAASEERSLQSVVTEAIALYLGASEEPAKKSA